jgi:histidinol-phosphate aminotransferase
MPGTPLKTPTTRLDIARMTPPTARTAARAAFLAAADEANRYPGGVYSTLIDALTRQHQVDRSWIHLTPGSGALLSAATLAFTGPTRSLVTAAPTYEAPTRTAQRTGATVHAVPVTADGRLDLDAMMAKAAGSGLIYVCNPNNPTGGSVPGSALAAFVERLKTAAPEARVLVDEAYFEYGDEPGYATAVPLAVADRRVLVTRTFSKVFGMAGLRVGYAIAHPDTLAGLEAHGPDGTLSNASLAAAAAAFTDTAHVAAECARNRAVRQFTRERFEAAGYRVLPSAANFVMVDIKRDAGSFGWECRRQRIAVARPFPPLDTCMRLTIGTQAEMDEAVPAILALLQAPAPPSARLRQGSGGRSVPVDWVAGTEC